MTPQPQACHNCRRQRLKCDRALPHCLKCINRGQECLGYQRLFRWEQGVASRGKMRGMTFEEMRARHESSNPQSQQPPRQISPLGALTDPLMQILSPASRKYLSYFASDVCKAFVLYDIPKHNPFRELITLTHQNPALLQIIVANSALHMSNACQKSLSSNPTAFPFRHSTNLMSSPCSRSSAVQQLESYNDALAAKQRALYLLKSDLTRLPSVDIDVTLAVVLLFIEFELLDTGRDTWRYHINGARTIIDTLGASETLSTQTAMTPLRSCLISNCLVFDILGSTLAGSMGLVPNDTFSRGAFSLLQDAEGNHCSSLPAVLLQLIQTGAHVYDLSPPSSPSYSSAGSKEEQAFLLLHAAQSFDPLAWATDLLHRAHVAFAHRAAVCIYLSRVLLSLFPTTKLPQTLEALVTEIITHLSFIQSSNALFTATTWPAFVAGAETNDCVKQAWVARRFQELWEVEPWGLIREALGVLEKIWVKKRSGIVPRGQDLLLKEGDGNWIQDLKGMGVDWLII